MVSFEIGDCEAVGFTEIKGLKQKEKTAVMQVISHVP
jgi:hypothetical protein